MHPPEWPKWKRLTVPCFGEDVEQLELLYSADESVRGYNCFGKLVVSIHECQAYIYLVTQQLHSWVSSQEKWVHISTKRMFITALFKDCRSHGGGVEGERMGRFLGPFCKRPCGHHLCYLLHISGSFPLATWWDCTPGPLWLSGTMFPCFVPANEL